MLFHRSTLSIWLLTIAISLPAWSNSAIDNLRQLLAQEHFTEAFAFAQKTSKENAGNPDFDFLYAKAARKTGHAEISIFALERVIAKNPTDADSIYERGLALLETKDFLSARKAFRRVVELGGSGVLADNALKLLQLTDKSQMTKEKSHEIFVDSRFDAGFSSNVNAGTNNAAEFLFQGPAVKDGFTNLSAAILFEKYISKHDAVFVSFAIDNRKNFRSPYWDYNIFGGRIGAEFSIGRVALRFPIDTEFLLVDYKLLRIMATFAVDATYKWDDLNTTSFSVKARPKVYQASSDNHIALPLVLHHEYKNSDSSMSLNAELSYSRGFAYTGTPGPFVNSHLKALVDFSYEFAHNHFLLPSLRFTSWEFPVSSNLQGPRRDQSFQAQLAYEWKFSHNWSLVPTFLYSLNSSTDKEQNYDRYEARVGLRFQL
jgi:tetratricopeptide (TPR) repeat protein